MEKVIKLIQKIDGGKIIEEESLAKYTSLKIGGTCRLMYFPKDIHSLRIVYQYLLNNKVEYFIIGRGTNLVVNDSYFDKVFINLKELNKCTSLRENKVLVLSGCSSSKVAYELAQKRYIGSEFLSVIPGSIGGAIYMNAGAYSKQISDIVDSVIVLNESGTLELIKKEECQFNYRTSIFKKKKYIIVGCILKLTKINSKEKAFEKIKQYVSNKRNTQPLNTKNAGSTFVNPENIQAWEVVDKLGFRGKVNGGAKVSDKHTNFLINHNHATFQDIYDLMIDITINAKEKYNIDLECEWNILK